ncbi:MAG: hypothetical protein HC879_22175 [Leptolyngbyaceae cyanobacterium SL_5_9]|nr:hypothetical protein [Leptolyngbyaceae cyanobacterium SL_5_9]
MLTFYPHLHKNLNTLEEKIPFRLVWEQGDRKIPVPYQPTNPTQHSPTSDLSALGDTQG